MDAFTEKEGLNNHVVKETHSVSWPSSPIGDSLADIAATGIVKEQVSSIKIDPETEKLISDAAHFLGVRKRNLVAEAIQLYLQSRREELRAKMQEAISRLDEDSVLP